jgi:lysophospholipase L1-like esterase
MVGYVLVVAMVGCAVAAVIVATALGESRRPSPAPESGAGERLVIAAIGASDATGEGTRDPERENWIAQLSAQLPANVEVATFGTGGAWLADAHLDQVPKAVAIEPDIVIGWLIVNDLTQGALLSEYVQLLDAVLADLARPGTQVIFGNAPRLWDLPAFAGDANDLAELRHQVEEWNQSLLQVASKYDVVIVDLIENAVEAGDVSDDGFHPSPSGHAKLAASFKPHVLAAIDRARSVRLDAASD